MRIRSLSLVPLLILLSQTVVAQWHRIDDRLVSAMDLSGPNTGLISYQDPTHLITKFTDTSSSGVFSASSDVTGLVIQDSAVAWATVKGAGVYVGKKGWTAWTKTSTRTDVTLLAAFLGNIYVNIGRQLNVSTDGASFQAVQGLAGDSITAIDRLTPQVLIAVSLNNIYRSDDGGQSWSLVRSGLNNDASIFADRYNGLLYTGGDILLKSIDSGKTWFELLPPSSLSDSYAHFEGQVIGVHDCSGNFYVTSRSNSTLVRSETGGATFQEAGPEPISENNLLKGWAFNRGSIIYWWDKTLAASETTNGLDNLITSSIGRYLYASTPMVFDTMCGKIAAPLAVSVASFICTPVSIDSISVLNAPGTVNTHFPPFVLRGTSKTVTLNYVPKSVGVDSLHLRLWFHGMETDSTETLDFRTSVTSITLPPGLLVTDSLSFGSVHLDSTRTLKLEIRNSGCGPLRIDSVVSSNDAVFSVVASTMPITVLADSSAKVSVRFTPHAVGRTLESIELGTNAGHLFVKLEGTGTTDAASVTESVALHFALYPNPATSSLYVLTSDIDDVHTLEFFDELGRLVRTARFVRDEPVSLEGLQDGAYTVRIGSHVSRLIVHH